MRPATAGTTSTRPAAGSLLRSARASS
jgi:hypothetical protein